VGGATVRELKFDELRKFCDKDKLGFKTTSELSPSEGLIGQGRAEEALRFGLAVKAYGYNIFVSGLPGTGKTTFACEFAKQAAKTDAPPPDLCYVHNFDEPKYPNLLSVKNGLGNVLKSEMEELVTKLCEDIPALLAGEEFDNEKNAVVKVFHDKREELITNVTKYAKENGFGAKSLNSGMQFLPIIDGEMINEEQYDQLTADVKADITARSETITERTAQTMRKIKVLEAETNKKVEELEYKHGLFLVGRLMAGLLVKFENEHAVLAYLSKVKEDVLANLGDFLDNAEQNDDELMNIVPWAGKKPKDDAFNKYKINLIAHSSSAPVIVSHNPTYASLVGEIEYENEMGNLVADFMKIKPGLLHTANGGYLILQANDVLTSFQAWETIKRALRTKEIITEPIREFGGGVITATLKPAPVPLDVKVILVGPGWCYDILHEYDDDFQKLFKIHAEFDYEMPYTPHNTASLAQLVKKFAREHDSLEFDCGAVARLIEYSVRLADNQEMMSTQMGKLTDILTEAVAWAKIAGAVIVTDSYIEKAIAERDKRLNMYEEKLGGLIDKNFIMIDTDGAKTAQINGLAVLSSGGYAFAKPSRITATTYVGKAGVVNIEKEAEMSGSIHDKGVEVLTGYLGQMYAQEFPLSLSCRICFEQNYNGIDGDSASSTELYAILSSLSETPISQEIAVTGSVNQFGKIQPIGGVSHKIEGFFDICKKRGLTGTQGVIIPRQNVKDLVLKDAVIDAVKNGKFSIYAIDDIDEGIEILMETPARTIHEKVLKKLKKYYNQKA